MPQSFKKRNSTSMIHNINKLNKKDLMIIFIDAKKATDKIKVYYDLMC